MNGVYGKPSASYDTVNYKYDNANRLLQSQSTYGSLDEKLTYDVMGNIDSLVRLGLAPNAASLGYTYNSNSNQLNFVTNNGSTAHFRTYLYDGNGNITSDSTTKLLSYNMLNLPMLYKKGSTNLCTYYYDAGGNKLRDTSFNSHTSWDYLDGIVYQYNDAANTSTISYIQTQEGRALMLPNNSVSTYTYDLKDYLGNVRASFDGGGAGGTSRIIQENSYYPFGLSMKYYDNSNDNRNLYNGKELQFNLVNQYDYGARFYDPVIGRFTSVDPLAEKGRRWSPYAYGMDDPIRMVDPDGMWPFPVNIRSFAPFDWFGGYFIGDGNNRGYTTSSTATARLKQSFTVDPNKGTVTGLKTSSNASYNPVLGVAVAKDDRGSITNLKSTENKDGSNTTSFTSNMAGHNPLVPGSPDIDVHTNFTLTENDKAGTLKVNAVQTGDAFPSAETMIGDTKGNQLFIGVSAANGNPYTSLPGDNDRPMMQANFTITMDGKGVFTGVQQGDKKYTPAEWNKMNQNKPTVQQ